MEEEIIEKLDYLLEKHKILDGEIDSLVNKRDADPFTLVRKKKEKLRLRDEINRLQSILHPDLIA